MADFPPEPGSLPPWALDPMADGEARVLVVDDDRLAGEHVAMLVRELGLNAQVASTWTDALRVFSGSETDLVLMDAVMPNVDGFKLTRLLRERSRSYVPILFLTGLSDERSREESVLAGADDLLTKPVDRFELRMRLTAMLRVRRLTRALEEKHSQLEAMASLDALTGLNNRRMLDRRLPVEVSRARRYGRELCVLLLDIDHFKRVNDDHGHAAGDAILTCAGSVMIDVVRDCDQAFRYGGEELVLLAPDTPLTGAIQLAERVRAELRRCSAEVSDAGPQTASVGIARLSDLAAEATAADLLGAADAALYAAKRAGRDRVRVYSQA